MGYVERYIIPQTDTHDPNLRECLRCLYMHGDRALRPDMPPDLVLRDLEPPDLVLKDEVTGEFWELSFGEEIVVTPYPYAVWWRTGIVLNDGWNMRMRRGEIVVSEEFLPPPYVTNVRGEPNFILEVAQGELVYWPLEAFSVVLIDRKTAGVWWKMTFGQTITVVAWGYEPTEVTGIKLNGGWEWQVENRQIITTQKASLGPWLHNEQQEWVDLKVVERQSVYRPGNRYVFGKEQFDIAWALYFREEITVWPWEWVTPINGLMLAKESPTWAMEMRKAEIVLEENVLPPVPYLKQKPDKWKFGLEMINGEMVYTPYREADPRSRGERDL